jgi:hypothetical protein
MLKDTRPVSLGDHRREHATREQPVTGEPKHWHQPQRQRPASEALSLPLMAAASDLSREAWSRRRALDLGAVSRCVKRAASCNHPARRTVPRI